MDSDDRVVMTCFAMIFGGGFLAVCLVAFSSVGFINWAGTIAQQTADIVAITQTVQQIEVRQTLAVRMAQITATQRAYQTEIENAQLLLEEAKDWEIVVSDGFDNNDSGWRDGPIDSKRLKGEAHVSEGKYYLDLEAIEDFVYYSYPDIGVFSDFYLEVETEQLSGPMDGKHGLIFRRASGDYYYYFAITEDQRYKVSIRRADEWERVIPTTFSDAIQPGQLNRLVVIAIQEKFYFFINDTFVNYVDNALLLRGKVGVITGISLEGDTAQYVFDNFEVRIPPSVSEK